ncbi:major facilitator superfamily domain-containing protein [Lentinula boryana]|uniref:Major facilitator superfamily domain-containing protein n=1 Tax=Lentinula boryana TaxID=40481 RepID=A0ABQ8QCA4_9AGAR|nr:major facilitator superfamily domain-containing protein [Lentinula boryana]
MTLALQPSSVSTLTLNTTKISYVTKPEKFNRSKDSNLTINDSASDDDLPDGEFRAWVVLFGTMCIAFTTSGYMSTWGVFQAHYEQSVLKELSPSTIAWIGSLQQSCLYIPTLIFAQFLDIEYLHTMLATASLVFIVATFLIAQCNAYWQFLLLQGILTGITAGVFTGPITTILSQWFLRRRGLALGLYAAGSSMGGTILPIINRALIPLIGFPWTIRVVASIIMLGMILGNLTIKQRIVSAANKGHSLDLSPMKSRIFILYCSASFFIYLGYYTFTTYLASSAISVGVSISFSFYLVSVCNACSGMSRIISGLVADRFGAINLMIPAICLSTTTYYVWPFVHSQSGLIFLSVVYGVSIGPFASLVSKPVLDFGEKDQLGQRVGILMSMVGIAMLTGTPISGAVNTYTSSRTLGMGLFAGSTMLFGAILMAIFQYILRNHCTCRISIEK